MQIVAIGSQARGRRMRLMKYRAEKKAASPMREAANNACDLSARCLNTGNDPP